MVIICLDCLYRRLYRGLLSSDLSLIAVLQQGNGDGSSKKGDFVVSSDHVIEIVAKTALLIQNATGQTAPVYIGTQSVFFQRL